MEEQLNQFLDDAQNQEGLEDITLKVEQLQTAVLWGTDWTAETIVTQIKKGRIDLNPRFQRREAWDDRRKSSFIESLICGFPIPQIILAEGKTKSDPYIVIDGKQRLISLRKFFSSSEDKIFSPLKLKSLSVLKDLNEKTYDDIKNDPQAELLIGNVDNQPIRTIIIRNWPNEEFLYTVFLRLNTGSLPLSTQELRQALHPGPFLNFCDEYSCVNRYLQDILRINKADYRMRDIELMVRYFAFRYYISDYNGNLKVFLDNSVNLLNHNWKEREEEYRQEARNMDEAIQCIKNIFKANAFRKYKNGSFDNRFNRAVFDIMMYYFADSQIRAVAMSKQVEILEGFKNLSRDDIRFVGSLETSTKTNEQTSYRFTTWGKTLEIILGEGINIPNIRHAG